LFNEKIDTVFFDGSNFNNAGADMIFRLDSNTNMIGFCFMDLIDRSNDGIHPFSLVSYKTDSVSNKKITKIEWRDAGFANSMNSDTAYNDSVNFQVWYYEKNDDLEVHFGTHKFFNPLSDLFDRSLYGFNFINPFFGFMKNYDPSTSVFDTSYFVSNATTAPKVDSASIDSMMNADSLGYKKWPANGVVFRFSKPATGIMGVQLNEFTSVFPTAFVDRLFINITKENFEGQISILDLNGQLIVQQKALNGINTLQTSSLPPGSYIINIRNSEQSVFYKVLKN
jgi:hypothetical protein